MHWYTHTQMLRAISVVSAMCLLTASVLSAAPEPQARKGKTPATKMSTSVDVTCPAELGKGVKSKREFCDLAISTDPTAGVVLRVPPHTGASTLLFDLHNRFPVSGTTLPFANASALVAILNGNNGKIIERAAVAGELRKELDLFDRIAGAGPGDNKTVAAGRAQSVKVTLPAAVTSVSIVGVRLEITTKDGRTEFTTPGRPVAIGSNFRIEYAPAAVRK